MDAAGLLAWSAVIAAFGCVMSLWKASRPLPPSIAPERKIRRLHVQGHLLQAAAFLAMASGLLLPVASAVGIAVAVAASLWLMRQGETALQRVPLLAGDDRSPGWTRHRLALMAALWLGLFVVPLIYFARGGSS
jgi:hypothetical protein